MGKSSSNKENSSSKGKEHSIINSTYYIHHQCTDMQQVVVAYLRKQNRPYNVADIFTNLKGTIPKTLLQKILSQSSEKCNLSHSLVTPLSPYKDCLALIHSKTYGKQTIYAAKQEDQGPVLSKEEEQAMDTELLQMNQQMHSFKEEVSTRF
jgi:TBPIP/Hop2 winged helix domain